MILTTHFLVVLALSRRQTDIIVSQYVYILNVGAQMHGIATSECFGNVQLNGDV